MWADFWAGYVSGAAGILVGNPLDIVKVRLQVGESTAISAVVPPTSLYGRLASLVRGVTAPVLGYGSLNALLFVSYNRTLMFLDPTIIDPTDMPRADLLKVWSAGAVGGLATWIVSAPTELIKCRTQLSCDGLSSWAVVKDVWRQNGLKGLYFGGGVTSVRDAIGYGFYFWSYEFSKRWVGVEGENERQTAAKVLLCGGIAGVVTWASIFPLDVIKTRLQTQPSQTKPMLEETSLLTRRPLQGNTTRDSYGAYEIAKIAYREQGSAVFFRGLGVCSVRAFIVNAVQWTVYEWIMRALRQTDHKPSPRIKQCNIA